MSGITNSAHTNLIGMNTQQLRNHISSNQNGSLGQQNQANAVQVTHLHHAQGIAGGIGQLSSGGTGLVGSGALGAVGAQIV